MILISLWFSTGLAVYNDYESSAEYLYHFSDFQFLLSIFFAISFLASTYLRIRLKHGLLLFIFVLWLCAGRYFYLKEPFTGSIGTSFYFHQDNRFDLVSKESDNYEKVMANIYYEKLSFWRIQFIHGSDKRTIFIGPFAWKSTTLILSNSLMRNTERNKF